MSGIYIKGMKMPKNCLDCELCHYEECFCQITGNDCKSSKARNEDCPLVEVPKHGRLIDADETLMLVTHGEYPNHWIDKNELLDRLRNAPITIIPADKGGAG